jgi:hypothetical protein
VAVVGAAEESDVVHGRMASLAKRNPVLELEKAPLFTAPTLRVDERALAAVSPPHLTPDCSRNVA